MGQQLTIRLPDDLGEALAEVAEQTGRKRSEVVRMALREHLRGASPAGRPADLARHLIGSLDSGLPDLVENQRRYLLDSIKRDL